jgi:hypothetical protein
MGHLELGRESLPLADIRAGTGSASVAYNSIF